MSGSLDDAMADEMTVRGIACSVPESFQQAVMAYTAKRRRDLATRLATQNETGRREARAGLRSVDWIEKAVLGDERTESAPDITKRPEKGRAKDEHMIWLAHVLTPPGWDADGGLLQKLVALRDLAAEQVAAADTAELSEETSARLDEVAKMLIFLQNAASHGTDAAVSLRNAAGRSGAHAY